MGHLPQNVLAFCSRRKDRNQRSNPALEGSLENRPLKDTIIPIAKMEKRAILRALRQTNGNKLRAAESLGIGKTTLYRKLKEYGLDDKTRFARSTAAISNDGTSSDLACA
jgi:DNA-binding NtrC family response regulator